MGRTYGAANMKKQKDEPVVDNTIIPDMFRITPSDEHWYKISDLKKEFNITRKSNAFIIAWHVSQVDESKPNEKLDIQEIPQHMYGTFYSEYCYLFVVAQRTVPESDEWSYKIWNWIGKDASEDKVALVLQRIMELNEYLRTKKITIHFEYQENTSNYFMCNFSSFKVKHGNHINRPLCEISKIQKIKNKALGYQTILIEQQKDKTETEIRSNEIYVEENMNEIILYLGQDTTMWTQYYASRHVKELKKANPDKTKIRKYITSEQQEQNTDEEQEEQEIQKNQNTQRVYKLYEITSKENNKLSLESRDNMNGFSKKIIVMEITKPRKEYILLFGEYIKMDFTMIPSMIALLDTKTPVAFIPEVVGDKYAQHHKRAQGEEIIAENKKQADDEMKKRRAEAQNKTKEAKEAKEENKKEAKEIE